MSQLLETPTALLASLVVIGALCAALWVARARLATMDSAREEAARLRRDAQRDADASAKELILNARERAYELIRSAEADARAQRDEALALKQRLTDASRRLSERQTALDQAGRAIREREAAVKDAEGTLTAQRARCDELVARQEQELSRLSGLTVDEAKDLLIHRLESDARRDAAHLVTRLEHEARETATDKAKQIIAQAIQRSAPEHTIETTVSVVDLPSDDLKGRIIGREGRNIRALETATGVELIIDDTPGAVILSSFDPYRRTVAKLAIEELVADGRIHPARIEEVVERVRTEVDEATLEVGESAALELGLHDMHPDIHRLLGRLRFRTSYGQNVLAHSKEVAHLAGIMARELGLDVDVSVRAALVHDIGKAIDRDFQGTHLELGIEFLRQHGERQAVIDAVAAHHMDIDWPSPEAMIVQAADAISAARPGARRDILESYIKRLEALEAIAESFKGVSKAFALQAGREVRIMVESDQVSDEEAVWLSKDIRKRIENELEYPGQIKVTVIRETRAIDYAR